MYIIVQSNEDLNKLQKAKNNSNVLVWYYAEWCGHCQMMKEEWEKLVKSNPHVDLAKVSDDYVSPDDNIRGYPTIKLFKSNKSASGKGNSSVINYEGSRDADSLKTFLNENVKQKQPMMKRKRKQRNTSRKSRTNKGRKPRRRTRRKRQN